MEIDEATGRAITYELQYRKCGKRACKPCRNGQGHGPYWYAYWSDEKSGKLKSLYIGKKEPRQLERIFIYALCEPDLWQEVRYIGVTDKPEARLSQHMTSATSLTDNTPKTRWLQTLHAKGLAPVFVILAEVETSDRYGVEREWIRRYRKNGAHLTNIHPIESSVA